MARLFAQMVLDSIEFDALGAAIVRISTPDIQIFEIGSPHHINHLASKASNYIPEVLPVSFTYRDKGERSASLTVLVITPHTLRMAIELPVKRKNTGSI